MCSQQNEGDVGLPPGSWFYLSLLLKPAAIVRGEGCGEQQGSSCCQLQHRDQQQPHWTLDVRVTHCVVHRDALDPT